MSEGKGTGSEGEFFALLAALRDLKSGPLRGEPSDRALARAARVSPTTVGGWLRGAQFPQDVDRILAVIRAVAARVAARDVAGQVSGIAALLDEERWREAYKEEAGRRAQVVSAGVQRARAIVALSGEQAGRPLAEVTDPFALEVHRPVEPEFPQPGLPVLPAYVPRGHDVELRRVVLAAVEGRSGIAVLVGASSTGKTRACWEALQLLREQPEQWRLWHPIDPSRPAAVLSKLSSIGPRTVVWLNDAQLYLDVADGQLGERVAAGLRELLRDPTRAPVLVLATLWPQFWDSLSAPPAALAAASDVHEQARKLLDGHAAHVAAAFTPAELRRLPELGDPRLAQAAAAPDGEVIQFLAGVPELLARYRNAPPPAKALIHAAMDARRLGMGVGLPYAFLGAAAPGYLTDSEWDALGDDWLEQALAYAAVPCKGVRGPLTRIRPRPTRSRPARKRLQPASEHSSRDDPSFGDGPLYRLADYLDQYGRRLRSGRLPPASFWAAAADYAFPADQAALGEAAHVRGLFRDAAQLYKNAAAHGHTDAVMYLAGTRHIMRGDVRALRWAVTHVSISDPYAVARLLGSLEEMGARRQVTALLRRDPAARASLADADEADDLLLRLLKADAKEQFAVLAARAARDVSLKDPAPIARLLRRLRVAGAAEQVVTLASRAVQVSLSEPAHVAGLLRRMRDVGAEKQVKALADRTATQVPLTRPDAIVRVLASLHEVGAHEQFQILANRATAHVSLDDPEDVDWLLSSYQKAGAEIQIARLLGRTPAAHVPMRDPYAVGNLLERLQEVGAGEQVQVLAARAAAHVSLDKPALVTGLLGSLREVGAGEQVEVLAARAAAHVSLDKPALVARLLDTLQGMGLENQAVVLAGRAAAHVVHPKAHVTGHLVGNQRQMASRDQPATSAASPPREKDTSEFFSKAEREQERFRFGRETDGTPAMPWGWKDLD